MFSNYMNENYHNSHEKSKTWSSSLKSAVNPLKIDFSKIPETKPLEMDNTRIVK